MTNGNGGGPGKDFNKIHGTNDDDVLIGTEGADSIIGRRGNDALQGGLGADILDGGEGIDAADYSTSSAGVVVSLAFGTGTGGDAEGDTFLDIENLTGSAFADQLTGDDGANALNGGDGDDILVGGIGGDQLDGDGGSDTANYTSSDSGVSINLATGFASGGHATGDTLVDIEKVIGSAFGDLLIGDGDANMLFGDDGRDILQGGGGDDVLEGGAGGSVLDNEIIDGGEGFDTASYAGSSAGVSVNLATGHTAGGDAAADTLNAIENLTGSAFDDELTGDDGVNALLGGDGVDHLVGGLGEDALDGGSGDDILVSGAVELDTVTGGAGFDIISLMPAGLTNQNPVPGILPRDLTIFTDFEPGTDLLHFPVIPFDVTTAMQQIGDDVLILMQPERGVLLLDTLVSEITQGDIVFSDLSATEFIRGTADDDELSGTTSDDAIIGFEGNDRLDGDEGNDTLVGGAGNDLLLMNGSWADIASGGAGADVFASLLGTLSNQNDAVEATIADFEPGTDLIVLPSGQQDVLATAVQDGADVLLTLNPLKSMRLLQTQVDELSSDDFLFVNAGAILGTQGADDLEGTAGDDVIIGLDGDDRLAGHLFGTDSLTGGAGADVFSLNPSGVFIGIVPDDEPAPQHVTTIEDFEIGIDQVEFDAFNVFDVIATARQEGDDVAILYYDEFELVLQNTQVTDLQAGDFVFV